MPDASDRGAQGVTEAELTREDELRMLEEEELMLKERLDEVSRQIGTLRNQIEKEVE